MIRHRHTPALLTQPGFPCSSTIESLTPIANDFFPRFACRSREWMPNNHSTPRLRIIRRRHPLPNRSKPRFTQHRTFTVDNTVTIPLLQPAAADLQVTATRTMGCRLGGKHLIFARTIRRPFRSLIGPCLRPRAIGQHSMPACVSRARESCSASARYFSSGRDPFISL